MAAIVATPAALLSVSVGTTAANTGPPALDLTSLLGTVITPVIVIILLLLGKLRTEPEVKRLESENTSLRAQVHDKDAQMISLQSGLVDKAIPALTRSTLVLETLSPLLQTEVHLRRLPGSE